MADFQYTGWDPRGISVDGRIKAMTIDGARDILEHELMIRVRDIQETLYELAEYYEEETDYTVDKLTSRMEPIALVVVMVPVGTLVSGVYLMMTQSMRAIGAG